MIYERCYWSIKKLNNTMYNLSMARCLKTKKDESEK